MAFLRLHHHVRTAERHARRTRTRAILLLTAPMAPHFLLLNEYESSSSVVEGSWESLFNLFLRLPRPFARPSTWSELLFLYLSVFPLFFLGLRGKKKKLSQDEGQVL